MMVEEIQSLSNMDPWFLRKLQGLVGLETRLKINGPALARLARRDEAAYPQQHDSASPTVLQPDGAQASSAQEARSAGSATAATSGPTPNTALAAEHHRMVRLLREAKRAGFPDRIIAELASVPEMDVRQVRKRLGIVPVYKIVDTCAAEFEAATPYYYSCYDTEDEQ